VSTTGGSSQTWTSYNQPLLLSAFGDSSQFFYDANHLRWKQLATYNQAAENTLYIGGLLEKMMVSAGTTYRHYIPAGNNTIVYSRSTTPAIATYYLTTDHISSTSTITDQTGALVVEESYNPLGVPRDPTNWEAYRPDADQLKIAGVSRREYTGQEGLDNISLTNMNWRVFVPGRFISPDPHITDPMDPQSYNRYSYVANRPLTYVDPTGLDYWITCTQLTHKPSSGDEPKPTDIFVTQTFISTCSSWYTPDYTNQTHNTGNASAPEPDTLEEITVTAKRCPGPVMDTSSDRSYDPNDPSTHLYGVHTSIPALSEVDRQRLQDLWRNGPNPAPGIAPNTPDFTPTLLARVPFTPDANWIYIAPLSNGWENVTLPGHYFYSGVVINTVTTADGYTTLTSIGTGNTSRWFQNDFFGSAFFQSSQMEAVAAFYGVPRHRIGFEGSCNSL
jgi:RHS repeat-associated protein